MKITVLLAPLACLALSSLAPSQRAAESAKTAATAPAATVATASAPATQAVTVMPEGCIVERFDVPSPSMNRSIHALVVLPPEYQEYPSMQFADFYGGFIGLGILGVAMEQPSKRYPVLYALHGMGAPYACWSDMSPLRKALRQRPMIVASFDGDNAGWYIDSTQKPESQFTTFFFDEFIPYVDSHYRASGLRGVTGFSMGGYGALHYMLCKPEMFASVSSLSGAFSHVSDRGGRASPMLRGLLGDPNVNKAEYAKRAIFGRLEEDVQKHVKLPPLLIHCGTEDGLLTENRKMAEFLVDQNKLIAAEVAREAGGEADKAARDKKTADLLAARRINFVSMESPGAHNWPFWRDASEGVIDFHWRSFRDAAK